MAYIIIIYTHIHSINIYLLDILPAVLLFLYTFERQLNKKEKKSYSEHTHTLSLLSLVPRPHPSIYRPICISTLESLCPGGFMLGCCCHSSRESTASFPAYAFVIELGFYS
jgi:hypothetical protein